MQYVLLHLRVFIAVHLFYCFGSQRQVLTFLRGPIFLFPPWQYYDKLLMGEAGETKAEKKHVRTH